MTALPGGSRAFDEALRRRPGPSRPRRSSHWPFPWQPDVWLTSENVSIVNTAPCQVLEPPPFESVAPYTRACIEQRWGAPGWPEVDCPDVCLRPRACELPSPQARQDAADRFQIRVITEADAPPAHWRLINDLTNLSAGIDMVHAALALLMQNEDLVRWSVCRAASWARTGDPQYWNWADFALWRSTLQRASRGLPGNPDDDPVVQAELDLQAQLVALGFSHGSTLGGVGGLFSSTYATEPRVIQRCLMDALRGEMTVFLIDDFGADASATGGATDIFRGGVDNAAAIGGRRGTILPLEHPQWRQARNLYVSIGPLSSATRRASALCALVAISGTILHEWLHLCAFGHARDEFQCNAVQNQTAMMFTWAMGQRYPCLTNIPLCCPKTGDFYFASSEPSLPPDQVEPFPWNNGPCT